ncbi:UNVERIFIED_CONTAM: hypothetical protein PYX00_010193 [Menopon gallinae]|uniref:Cytochrome P450 n=1 Tax=Menopon gallinae TaxID=328185 RepID=A0AAW2HEE6_9NEOP
MEALESEVASNSYTYSFFTILFATIIILSIIHYLQSLTRYSQLGNRLPGPPTVPFLGNALYGLRNPEDVMKIALRFHSEYGSVIKGWMGGKLYVFFADPRDIEIVLSSQVHIDKSPDYKFFKPWLGDGLLISTGHKWRSHRKLIAPTFHLNVLKSFIGLFNENSRKIVKRMESEIGKEFDVHDYMSTLTVDILIETAMGIKKTHQDNAGYDYAMAVMKMCDIIHKRTYQVWLRFDALFRFSQYSKIQQQLLNTIHSLTNSVIREKKALFARSGSYVSSDVPDLDIEQEKEDLKQKNEKPLSGPFMKDDLDDDVVIGGKKRKAFLDFMLEQQGESKLTDAEIKEEVDTIMFEGHDTTAAGSSFTLCLLGLYQDIQDKVYEELREIFGDSDRPVTFADTVNMKYMERVIMETLRLYPPVPAIARELNEDIKLASMNEIVPAGAIVVIGTYGVHRRKDIWGENAEVFDPDNFLPERMQERHYYSYIPFSAGPRSCVGRKYALLKLKVILATILRTYRIRSDVSEKDFKMTCDIILKRKDGFRIRIEKRNATA